MGERLCASPLVAAVWLGGGEAGGGATRGRGGEGNALLLPLCLAPGAFDPFVPPLGQPMPMTIPSDMNSFFFFSW